MVAGEYLQKLNSRLNLHYSSIYVIEKYKEI
jgi:hypothetical protein